MAVLTRVTDFVPSTLIKSQEVDDELNQLVNLLSGVSTNKDALLKFSDGTNPVLRVDQLGAGVIQQWLQNGSVKSRINNNGSLESIAGPVIAASQLIAAPLTIDGATDIVLKSNGFIVGYPKCVGVDISTPGNVGTGLDSLHSFSLPAASLAANNDWVRWTAGGKFGANDDNKRLVVTFDSQSMEDTGLIDIDGQDWKFMSTLIRLSSTSVIHNTALWLGFLQFDSAGASAGTGGRFISRSTVLTVANLNSNNLTMLVQAESATATNDNITQNQTIVEVCQMS